MPLSDRKIKAFGMMAPASEGTGDRAIHPWERPLGAEPKAQEAEDWIHSAFEIGVFLSYSHI
jgi:hypothetical protein